MPDLTTLILDVPNFPKPGVIFKDFTPLLADAKALAFAVDQMASPFRGAGVEIVVGAESRGFIFGVAVAMTLGAGFVPVRKAGKLPRSVKSVQYALEYGTDRLEIHADAVKPGQRVLVVDDLLATGGTLEACCRLVSEQAPSAKIAGISVLIELSAMQGRRKVARFEHVHAVVKY